MSVNFNEWEIKKLTGYEPQTTFWQDFNIAEGFGINGIIDTYNRAFSEWKTNVVYLTELVMVLNWKLWYHYERKNYDFYREYLKAYEQANEYACDNLQGEDLSYFYNVTD